MDGDMDELHMIRSLLQAESTKDSSRIQEAQDQLLSSFQGSKRLQSTKMSSTGSTNGSVGRKKVKSATPVSRLLRHHKQRHPVILHEETTVREVATQLCGKRQSAALILKRNESDGKARLVGICSEVDICRRVVGESLNPDTTFVRDIMTKDPCCVDPNEDFSVVLQMMVKHRFRHLPVVVQDDDMDDQLVDRAGICGMVDITQCLYDAIHKIERLQANQADFFQAIQHAQFSEFHLDAEEAQTLAQRTLQALMDSISPSVGSILQKKSLLKLDVEASVLDASKQMKATRMTAVLVFEGEDKFVGILTCKDVMARIVAKGIDAATAKLGDFMTGNPDTVKDDSSVLDALHIMQTERYLHLPVVNHSADGDDDENVQTGVNNNNGAEKVQVCGILDVLDCAVHTFTSSAGKAAHVLGTRSSTAGTNKQSMFSTPGTNASHHQRPPLYHPTPTISVLPPYDSSESLPSAPMYTHQQWRDPDSISAFSEVRSASRNAEEDELLSNTQEKVDTDAFHSHHRRNKSTSNTLNSTTINEEQQIHKQQVQNNLVIKVKDLANGKVYRLSEKSVMSLDDLINHLARATGRPTTKIQLVYLDEDKDQVELSNDTAFQEAKTLALQQCWKKLDCFILDHNNHLASRAKISRDKFNIPIFDDPLVVAGLVVAATAVLAVFYFASSSSNSSKSSYTYQRRYR